jgi:hypothetical protein
MGQQGDNNKVISKPAPTTNSSSGMMRNPQPVSQPNPYDPHNLEVSRGYVNGQWSPPPVQAAPKITVDTDVSKDKNIQTYKVPDNVSQGFYDLGRTVYKPTSVSAGTSVANVADRYAIDATKAKAAVLDQTLTNRDATTQRKDAALQTQQYAALRAAALGLGPVSPAVADNLSLLHQGQAFQTSLANTARGGSEQRAALQREALAANGEAGQENIATLAALQAQQQEAARQQAVNVLGTQAGQDQSFLGAAYGIANADAERAFQVDTANQNTATQAGINNQQALLTGTAADQNNVFGAQSANDAATLQAYRDTTARQIAGNTGEMAAASLGLDAKTAAQRAQIAAQENQLGQAKTDLDIKLAKEAKRQADEAADRQMLTSIISAGVPILTAGLA